MTKQAHRATHWPSVHGLLLQLGASLRATESEISAALYGPNGSGTTLPFFLILLYIVSHYIDYIIEYW